MKIRNLRKLATPLSSFNFIGASYCNVSFYFVFSNNKVFGSGIDTYETEAFKHWKKRDWIQHIESKANSYRESFDGLRFPIAIVCAEIVFYSADDERLFPTMYCVEITDVQKCDKCNRVIFYPDRSVLPLCDAYLTAKEAGRIRGVSDVIRLGKTVPGPRRRVIPNDLPICIANGGVYNGN